MDKPLTILLVDDDFDDKEMFVEAVAEIDESITCETAGNGLEALSFLKNASIQPDVIFLDLNMPRMSGFQCLQQLKMEPSFSNIPVVIYTTSKQVEDKEQSKKFGACYFLTKPVSIDSLKDELLKAFEIARKTIVVY